MFLAIVGTFFSRRMVCLLYDTLVHMHTHFIVNKELFRTRKSCRDKVSLFLSTVCADNGMAELEFPIHKSCGTYVGMAE